MRRDAEKQRNRELENQRQELMSQTAFEAHWCQEHHPIACHLQERPVAHFLNAPTHSYTRSPVRIEATEGRALPKVSSSIWTSQESGQTASFLLPEFK